MSWNFLYSYMTRLVPGPLWLFLHLLLSGSLSPVKGSHHWFEALLQWTTMFILMRKWVKAILQLLGNVLPSIGFHWIIDEIWKRTADLFHWKSAPVFKTLWWIQRHFVTPTWRKTGKNGENQATHFSLEKHFQHSSICSKKKTLFK